MLGVETAEILCSTLTEGPISQDFTAVFLERRAFREAIWNSPQPQLVEHGQIAFEVIASVAHPRFAFNLRQGAMKT